MTCSIGRPIEFSFVTCWTPGTSVRSVYAFRSTMGRLSTSRLSMVSPNVELPRFTRGTWAVTSTTVVCSPGCSVKFTDAVTRMGFLDCGANINLPPCRLATEPGFKRHDSFALRTLSKGGGMPINPRSIEGYDVWTRIGTPLENFIAADGLKYESSAA